MDTFKIAHSLAHGFVTEDLVFFECNKSNFTIRKTKQYVSTCEEINFTYLLMPIAQNEYRFVCEATGYNFKSSADIRGRDDAINAEILAWFETTRFNLIDGLKERKRKEAK